MKVLFVATGLSMGGAERQVVDLADELAQRGHDVCIASLTGEVRVKPASPKVRIVRVGMSNSLGGFISGYRSLRRLVREFRPDVVHSHMVHANVLTRLVRLTTRMPRLVSTAHNTNEGGRLRMLAYRLTDPLADLTTNVSDDAVAAFEAKGAVPRGTMVAVTNGIDIDRFSPDPGAGAALRSSEGIAPDGKVLLSVGRLVEEKDHDRLLSAFAPLAHAGDFTLWIVGQGPLLGALQARAAELGVVDKVKFLGIRDDIPKLMNAADVFVLSSVFEGFGLVVAEAMACEKVVVATDSGGVGQVLGDCGFLVPPRDTDALHQALSQALAMAPTEAHALGQRGRARVVAHYSLRAAVDKWTALYTEPLKGQA
jgi:glycosyltransferase involved in cell wall biosynthesis